ncbi:MAG TPA: type II secretion system protein GspN [Nitrospirales bacterium]|nr:type II secretion system protein GspN [Nitrospirales bacterium]HIN33391.1 type II secretion system protein GspN [Nitrospirales bacterium]
MTRLWSSLWRWGAYGFYAILIFGVCAYITFPSQQFHAWLMAEADRRFGIQMTARALQSRAPLRLDIDGAMLSIDSARVPPSRMVTGGIHGLPIEHLSLELHVWPLLLGQGGVLSTEINVFGGVIRGTLTAKRDDGQWQYHVKGDGERIRLQHVEEHMLASSEEGQVFTAGTGAMRFDFVWTGENVRSGAGTVSVSMDDTTVNVAGLSPVAISALSGSLTRDQRGWWRTDDVQLTGANNGFAGTGQARFLFDDPVSNSMINLSVSVTMDDSAKRQHPQLAGFMPNTGEPALLTVTGTLSRPVILINGVPILAR